MTQLEDQLARSLAAAVNAESEKFIKLKLPHELYQLPGWYQPAVEALAKYERQQDIEKNRVNY